MRARRACWTCAKCSCIVQEMAQQAPDEVAALEAAVRAATSQNLAKNGGVKRGKLNAHDDALADGIPSVQKMTQEPSNPDEVVDFGAAVKAASSVGESPCETPFQDKV